jgi:putative acetyltransferase
MEIRVDDPTRPDVVELLRDHLRSMALHSPPESIHALGLEALCRAEVTLWTARKSQELLGCGAILELGPDHGEIKSMRTASPHLRQGVAASLMRHMLEEAKRRSYGRLSLETGSMAAFAPARSLYAGFGFRLCDPFGEYVEDSNSVFMTREL